VLVVSIIIFIGLLVSACSPSHPIVGRWEYQSGDYVYFFGTSEIIEFKSDGTVIERDHEEEGKWTAVDGTLTVVSDWGGTDVFSYTIAGNTLTIIDRDFDTIIYRKR
jgi:hypothetical protein